MQDRSLYLDVLMPLPLSQPVFTYRFEMAELEVPDLVGKLVTVPFGSKKSYTGVVVRQQRQSPLPGRRIKPILKLLPYPPLPTNILRLWQWAANYYMCSEGEILVAAIPGSFRPDGNQEEGTSRAALTLKGWLPSKRFLSDVFFQEHLCSSQKRSTAVTKALNFILSHYQVGDKLPMNIKEVGEWLEVSASVVAKLRKLGVLEEQELLPSEVKNEAWQTTHSASDPLSPLVRVGSSNILLMHAPSSHSG